MEQQVRSASEMVKMLSADPAALNKLKTDPIPVLKEAAARAEDVTTPEYFKDRLVYRIAVIVLGSLALIAAIGSIVLVFAGKTTPEVLVALGSAGVGALVGLFAPSPVGGGAKGG
jgi:hypothetical protein